ncbi:hypothetical protein L1049_013145 [Liquidambar formosana]|uniref:Protein kinase domain-containing protein n=1 Tax=Liquidambar formosana TaxID=63359 RepID=A0AAP0RP36_LIQFO
MAIDAVEPEPKPKYPPSQTSSTTEHTEPPPRLSTTSSDGAPPQTDFFASPSDDHSTTHAPRADTVSSISDPSTTATNVSIPNYTSTSYYDSSTTSISIRTTKSRTMKSPRSPSNLRDHSTTHAARADTVSSISNPSTTATNVSIPNCTSTSYYDSSTTSISIRSTKSRTMKSPRSPSNLRGFLVDSPYFYDLYEISFATLNFLANKYTSSTTASWRCALRNKEVLVFQRKLRRLMEIPKLKEILFLICMSRHKSVIKLLGVSTSDEHIYLVYEFVNGVSLADCLRYPKHPGFTVLTTWISRMQVAMDIADGLDYIHNNMAKNTRLVHKHINSSSIIVTEPSFNAKVCHLGTAQLCGETDENMLLRPSPIGEGSGEAAETILEEELPPDSRSLDVGKMYMAPEIRSTGIATQKSDVYAFGVVLLELFGEESPMCEIDDESGDFRRTVMIETARKAIEGADGSGSSSSSGGGAEEWGREGRMRMWVDKRIEYFPVVVAEGVAFAALECVHDDPDKRPDMARVAGMISKLYFESRKWPNRIGFRSPPVV